MYFDERGEQLVPKEISVPFSDRLTLSICRFFEMLAVGITSILVAPIAALKVLFTSKEIVLVSMRDARSEDEDDEDDEEEDWQQQHRRLYGGNDD